ncbi:MAG: sodium:solute symporter, partial [Cyclobacteriaceae bacterium]|nr:sodium:solute symporter [Cyclobacteriaceae bacterium HetDA_MAG_MS6]
SSLFTDGIQMLLFGCLLIIILTMVLPKGSGSTMFQSGDWSLSGGVDLLLVALLQGFSYPFHDPVMTDRGFIADAKTTLRSFLIAVPIGFVAIVFFSLIGVYAMQMGIVGQAAVQVAQVMGTLTMLAMNLIMITSASSTLDSTFSSFSKLVLVDLNLGKPTVTNGRKVMALVTVIGTLPILFDPEILAATTISGTMVIGLAPVFACWQIPVSSGAFVASVVTGVFFGLVYTLGLYPSFLVFSMGDYGALLSVNLLGTFCCFIVFFAFKWVK